MLPPLLLRCRNGSPDQTQTSQGAMNQGPFIFLGVLATFVAAWWGMIFAPQLQLGSQKAKMTEGGSIPYPAGRPGIASQGHQVYVANGCVYCHSQQVRQEG